MSVHVCECKTAGKPDEYHIRYPGWTQGQAQDVADRINAGLLQSWQEQKLRTLSEDGRRVFHLLVIATYRGVKDTKSPDEIRKAAITLYGKSLVNEVISVMWDHLPEKWKVDHHGER
jgi:hypothetical protein